MKLYNIFYRNQTNKIVKNSVKFVKKEAKKHNTKQVYSKLELLQEIFKEIGLTEIANNLEYKEETQKIFLNDKYDINKVLTDRVAIFFEPNWKSIYPELKLDFNGTIITVDEIKDLLENGPYNIYNIPYFLPEVLGYFRLVTITEMESDYLKLKNSEVRKDFKDIDLTNIAVMYDFIATLRRILNQRMLLSPDSVSKSQILNNEGLLNELERTKKDYSL